MIVTKLYVRHVGGLVKPIRIMMRLSKRVQVTRRKILDTLAIYRMFHMMKHRLYRMTTFGFDPRLLML
ncbi:MAG: hypothetical protein MI685_01115 [Chlorobiales bacterium]|nr:hypothetical protein [Chlorobiales bacterium]